MFNTMGCALLLLTGLAASRRAMRSRNRVPELSTSERTGEQGDLPFDVCQTRFCEESSRPMLPVFSCRVNHSITLFGRSGYAEGSDAIDAIVGTEAFFFYLNGGPLAMAKDKKPQRPLLLGLEEEVMCPPATGRLMKGISMFQDKAKYVPPVLVWAAVLTSATCFKVKFVKWHIANRYSTFCGCLSNVVRTGQPTKIVTEKFIGRFPDDCEFFLVRDIPKLRPLARPPRLSNSALAAALEPAKPPFSTPHAGVSPLAPALSLEDDEETPLPFQPASQLNSWAPTLDDNHFSADASPNVINIFRKPSKPLRSNEICAVSWNVGREWDYLVNYGIGSGIGMSGLKGPELEEGLKTLLQECGDAGIVAVTLQEGADPEVTKFLRELDPRRPLVASSFAGVQPWGHHVESLPFLLEHSLDFGTPIKEGVLIKYGQLTGRAHERRVVLTREHLLTFDVDKSEHLAAVGSPTNALRFDKSFEVTRDAQTEDVFGNTKPLEPCIWVEGMETLRGRPAQVVKFKMCSKHKDTEGDEDVSSWLLVLSAETLNSRDEEADAYILPFTQGVSLAILSAVRPEQVKLYTVDFTFATGGPAKGEGLQAWMKSAARAQLPTTADKGATIMRMELHDSSGNSQFLCLAACHLEAVKRELRTRQFRLVGQSLSALHCDSTIWMGDFNTRPNDCCPWKEVEFAVAHELQDHVQRLTWSGDDLMHMMGASQIVYSEMQPLVRPTFHKRFKRAGHDECGEIINHTDVGAGFRAGLILNTQGDFLEISKPALTESLLAANAAAFAADACGSPSGSTLCWGGITTRLNCEAGRCFNTVDDSHCPGYTDRILFDSGSTMISSSDHYWPVESLIEADHTPVVGIFYLHMA